MQSGTRQTTGWTRRAWSAAALALLLAGAHDAGAAKPRGAIQVNTTPAGADVTVDGQAYGASPATCDGLEGGLHLVVVRKDGFREVRRSVELQSGQRTALELKLEALAGLVLIQSSPTGAEVTVNGAFRGATPLMIPDFPYGEHRIKVAKNGYFEKEVQLTVADRTPQKIAVALVADAVSIDFASTPSGAEVSVNGAGKGQTPCRVEQIPSGTVEIEVKLAGYQPYREKISLKAGDEHKVDAKLSASPGGLQIVTLPEKARVYIDNQFRGESPVTLSGLAPGSYRVRVEMKGFDPDARTVEVKPGTPVVEEFRLVSNSGILLLVTDPPDVQVFIDGQEMGRTKAATAGSLSEPLRLEGLSRGEHTLQLTRRGYTHAPRKLQVEPNRVISLTEKLTRLFIPDVRLKVSLEGRETYVTGLLLQALPDGGLEVEIRPGVVARYTKAEIMSREPLRAGP
jgi:hypothetical protein